MANNITYKNEEEIKIQLVLPWLDSLGYKKETMEFEKTIEVQEGRKKKSIFADIVVYSDKKKETPLIVVDTKSPNEILSKSGRDQVISYARLLNKIAPLAVLTNGYSMQVFQTVDKTRIKNLPSRSELNKDFVNAVISSTIQNALRQEAKKELFIIDDVNTFKNLLKKCHNTIRNNEGFDPAKAFDELSKVLFAKMYEEKYNKDFNRFTLETFNATLKNLNVNIVQKQFEEIQNIKEFKGLFPEKTKIELQDRTIKDIVTIFEKYDLTLTNYDVKGEAFEYFLGDTFTGGLGQYFTPRNVVEFIVEAISPKIGEKIIDPFCGTGGFLIYAFDVVSEKIKVQDFSEEEKQKWRFQLSSESLYGTDWAARTSQSCKMNMIVHGDGNTGIHQHNGFLNIEGEIEEGKFDICLTNPPFGASETDEKILNLFDLGTGRTSQKREILAIERCIKLVKPNGIVAFILPDGLLNNDQTKYVREYISKETHILGVIGLNKETFEGYNATVKTSILILKKKVKIEEDPTQKIFMAVCTNSGYAPTGEEVAGNQLPDILFDFVDYYKNKKENDFIYQYSKVLTLNNITDRLDAERYIDVSETLDIELHPVFSEKLDSEIATIGKLSLEVKSNLKKIYEAQKFEFHTLQTLLNPISKKVKIEQEKRYRQLGVKGKAKGVFIREENYGKDIKATTLFEVQEGWFIYSRLFAQNGSFAYVTSEIAGGVVSSEFPTFEIINTTYEQQDLLDYLVFYLSSPQIINYIDRQTTGSTKESRARFKEEQFLALQIALPKEKQIFDEIIGTIRLMNKLQNQVENLYKKMENFPKSFQIAFPNINV